MTTAIEASARIRLDRDEFAEAVAWAARVLQARPVRPVLGGILLEGQDEVMTISGFDDAQMARTRLEVASTAAFTFLLPGRMLAEIAKSLPHEPVDLVAEGSRVALTCGRANFTLATLPVEDYPALPQMPALAGRVDAAVFASAVAQVSLAASREDTLPVLTGVRMEFTSDSITLAATDRYRLGVREMPWQAAGTNYQATALIRAKTLTDVARPLAGTGIIDVAMDQLTGLIGFSGSGRTSVARMLDGEFPDYNRLLPTSHATTVLVSTADFIETVKRVKLVNERASSPILLTMAGSKMDIVAGGGGTAQASEALPAEVTGDDVDIRFNPDYLLDGLQALESEVARLELNGSSKPAVISPQTSEEGEQFRYLLMPVRLGH